VAVFAGCVIISAGVGTYFGRAVRDVVRWKWLRSIDHAGGALFAFAAWSFAMWSFSTAALNAPVTSFASLINGSRIVTVLDEYMPNSGRQAFESLSNRVAAANLPTGITGALLAPTVEPPTDALLTGRAVGTAVKSVVRVEGTSAACKIRMTGTGFVAAKGYVVTNAHVVAGVDTVGVRVQGKGTLYSGKVVYLDPAIDIAVIKVAKVRAAPLPIGVSQQRGTELVVTGFPGGGRLTLIPARVRAVTSSKGTDIYGNRPVRREIYALRADIKQGDSGAPLLAADGSVVGLVFASSATDQQTGYALVPDLITAALDEASAATAAVDTGDCISE
jgi:S1-C subfamily serine protease